AIIDQNSVNALANFTTNANGASLTLLDGQQVSTPGDFSNQGSLTIDATGGNTGFTAGGNYSQSGAGSSTTLVAGGTLAATAAVTIQAGTLQGTGTVDANVSNSGTLNPGTSTTPGQITINGSYTQSASGNLKFKIAGRTVPGHDYDQVAVNGTM